MPDVFDDLEPSEEDELEPVDFGNEFMAVPEEPYWHIERSVLKRVLIVINTISKSNLDIISKSVFMRYDNGRVVISSTDKDIYFSCIMPLINDENHLTGSLVLDARQLVEVDKSSQDFIIYLRDDIPYVNLLGGNYPLERFQFSETLYKSECAVAAVQPDISVAELIPEFELLWQSLKLAARVEDRSMVVSSGYAYGNFLTSAVRIVSLLPDLTLRSRDLEILRLVFKAYKDDAVGFYFDDTHFLVTGDNFSYIGSATTGKFSQDLITSFNAEGLSINLDGRQLFGILRFLNTSITKAAAVSLITDKNGQTFILTSNRKGDESRFFISDQSLDLDAKVDIQVSLTKNIFEIMKASPLVSLTRVNDMLLFKAENVEALMGSK